MPADDVRFFPRIFDETREHPSSAAGMERSSLRIGLKKLEKGEITRGTGDPRALTSPTSALDRMAALDMRHNGLVAIQLPALRPLSCIMHRSGKRISLQHGSTIA